MPSTVKKRPRKSIAPVPLDPVLGVLAEKLKEFRLTKELTQEQLADEAEVERTRIGKIERGKVNPSVLTLATLCYCLDITLADLFAEIEISKKPIARGGTPRRANQATLARRVK